MPSKNSINKPKNAIIRSKKLASARTKLKKRASQMVTTVRAATGNNKEVVVKNANSSVANVVVSNKKARKLLRNKQYQMIRDGKKVPQKAEAKTDVEKVREAMWRVIEMGPEVTGVPVSQGTLLGQ